METAAVQQPSDGVDITPLSVQPPRIIKPVDHARLVMVETIYHSAGYGADPTAFEHRSSRKLSTNEQSLRRWQVVNVDWTSLESAWVTEASLLFIEAPTDAFLLLGAELENGTIVDTGVAVMPGESSKFTPIDISKLKLRSPGGTCRCTITLVPR